MTLHNGLPADALIEPCPDPERQGAYQITEAGREALAAKGAD